ncbi:MAG: triose-phosphate isomerase [Candidatus Diapherotrites archaeon]|nr:triose-phosphate isomerase [Candidatus Diapherotrites archaeon]
MEELFFLNFKTYNEATGKNALTLAGLAEKISMQKGVKIIVVPQVVDLRLITENCLIEVFAQNIDAVSFGSNTGKILPEAVKDAGAKGVVLNHAENKISDSELIERIKRAKSIELKVLVCAETIERAKKIALMEPDFIAIEPPELIGGTKSVSTENPEIISNAVKEIHKIKKIPVIAGAGINSAEDIKKALKLGASGVFVASSVVKAENQEEKLKELIKGFD